MDAISVGVVTFVVVLGLVFGQIAFPQVYGTIRDFILMIIHARSKSAWVSYLTIESLCLCNLTTDAYKTAPSIMSHCSAVAVLVFTTTLCLALHRNAINMVRDWFQSRRTEKQASPEPQYTDEKNEKSPLLPTTQPHERQARTYL